MVRSASVRRNRQLSRRVRVNRRGYVYGEVGLNVAHRAPPSRLHGSAGGADQVHALQGASGRGDGGCNFGGRKILQPQPDAALSVPQRPSL